MQEAEFKKLLKPDCYQVFLFTCPPSLPLSFALHPWFVVNHRGEIARYEIIASPRALKKDAFRVGHLCKDILPPLVGLRVARSRNWLRWPACLCGVVEGGEGSLAHRMAEAIEKSFQNYPHSHEYAYTGPNSNTYAQWVIDQFPESGFTLPWNAFGKHFLRRKRS